MDEAEKGLQGRLPGGGESCGSNYSKLKRLKQQADFISSGWCQALSGLRLCLPAPRLPWQVLPLTRQFQRQVFSLIQQTQRDCFSTSTHRSPDSSGLRHPTPGTGARSMCNQDSYWSSRAYDFCFNICSKCPPCASFCIYGIFF